MDVVYNNVVRVVIFYYKSCCFYGKLLFSVYLINWLLFIGRREIDVVYFIYRGTGNILFFYWIDVFFIRRIMLFFVCCLENFVNVISFKGLKV